MEVDKRLYTAGEKAPEPCSAYKDGFCTEMQRACDLCYESSMNLFGKDESLMNEKG